MKITLILASLFIGNLAFATPQLCPTNSQAIATCTAKAWVPMIPFVSVCDDGSKFQLVMDPGAGRGYMVYEVAETVTEAGVTYSAVEANTDNLQLTIKNSTSEKKSALLTFMSFNRELKVDFNCKL
jgi:hypothetical protein